MSIEEQRTLPGRARRPDRSRVRRGARAALGAALLALLLALLAGPLLRPLYDPDFFWHLRTGEWMLEHRRLAGEYLFSAAPPRTSPADQRFTMTSYWLDQVALAGLHESGGLWAIVALRGALLALLFLLVAARMRGDPLLRLALLVLAAVVLASYPAERPQYVTFVGTAALLLLLDGIGTAASATGARWRAAAVAPLMALWANCHGGFAAGVALLVFAAAAETAKSALARFAPLPTGRLRILLAAVAGGLAASLANPNGWAALRMLVQPGPRDVAISEYRSTLEAFSVMGDRHVAVFWALLALTLAGIVLGRRRVDPGQAALALVAGGVAFTRVRHVPLFLVIALPVASWALSEPRLRRAARAVAVALAIAAGAWFARESLPELREPGRAASVNEFLLPVEAADFLEAAGVRGNLFSQYAWGGYLLWRLDGVRTFIDGRNGDPRLMGVYGRIIAGDATAAYGAPYWKGFLAARQVHCTVTSYFNPVTGEFLGLVDRLLEDPAWVPVFVSPTSVVFLEDVPENRSAIRRAALPREQIHRRLLEHATSLTVELPDFVPARIVEGDLFLRLGNREAALRSYEAAARLLPGHPVAAARVQRVRSGLGLP